MTKLVTGIEIGNYSVKIAVYGGGEVKQFVTEELPENIVREGVVVSWESMADVLKDTMKKHHISCKNAAFVLSENQVFLNRITMPAMTIDQLKVNLPYEFRDYITDDMHKYFYDYAVVGMEKDEQGKYISMDLLAAATRKETIENFRTMCRRCGLKLVGAAPEIMAFQNIIRRSIQENNVTEPEDYGILDLGHEAIRVHIFTKGVYEVSRNIEMGLEAMTRIIAEVTGSDEHIAEIYKQKNQDNIWENEECMAFYNRVAVEVMRVVNFYGFNHPDNNLRNIYYCGGGAGITPLIREIDETVEPQLKAIHELFAPSFDMEEALKAGAAAVGITWE